MAKGMWGIGLFALAGCSMAHEEPPADVALVPMPSFGGTTSFIGGGQPALNGAVFKADRALKPVSGGTLLITKDGATAVVADPDRDQVLLVDLKSEAVTRTLTLDAGSEPGRAAQDAEGRVHVVLRGSGKLLSFDPASGEVLGTRSVCSYPRGVAVSPTDAVLFVACAEGKLLSLPADASVAEPLRTLQLDRDLRDVVAVADGLWVSRFRSGEILRLDGAGTIVRRTKLPSANGSMGESISSVAWRMVPNPSGGVTVVHQRAFAGEVMPSPGGYGESGVMGGLVSSAITTVSESGVAMGTTVALSAPLPVDIAQSPVSGR
ncbi:MAG TPA: hypothetical protein VEQ59_25325, partial [Polyangiaceae bacterium]|nr:hypothetical protein [Polyangiaceae bacterium]